MTNLRNVLDKLRANKAIASNLDKAQDLYSQKPYAQEWAEAYATVERWHLLPSALSIAGASFAFTSVFTQLPWWLSVLIGLPFATLFELLKEWVTKMGFRSFFKLAKFNYLLLASIMLYACSVTLSTWGAYRAYTILEQDQRSQVLLSHSIQLDSLERHYWNLSQEVKSANTQEKDSLLQVYDQRITESTQQLRAFEKQHDVNGVIAWKVRDTHGELVENINSLKNEKAKRGFSYQVKTDSSLNALKKEYQAVNSQLVASEPGLLATVEEELGAYLWLVIALALLVEATIFAFRRFSEYYLYRSSKEVELINESELLTINLDTLGQLGQFMQLQGVRGAKFNQAVFGTNGINPTIGFKPAAKPVSKEVKETIISKEEVNPDVESPQASTPHEAEKNLEPDISSPEMPPYVEAPHRTRPIKDTDYRKKYPELIADLYDLNQGVIELTTEELAERHGVSPGTIYRVKKALFI